MKFSQRYGYRPAEKLIQKDSLDTETRNSLWNALTIVLWDKWARKSNSRDYPYVRPNEAYAIDNILCELWIRHFKLTLDSLPELKNDFGMRSAYDILKDIVLEGEWFDVLDLFQEIIQAKNNKWSKDLQKLTNTIFENESVAYRVVDENIVEITSDIEIGAIEDAVAQHDESTVEHLRSALEKLADRKNPDLRNSIKESISAVESACQIFTGKPGATLGECLRVIKKHRKLHPAFEQAFDKLYGFTNDSGGIRHALVDRNEIPTAADAKFMLVAASAFVNYLWTVAAENGIQMRSQAE